jgi:hypothetical protein
MRELTNQLLPNENNGSTIIVGRSIWDVDMETDCLYPVTYVKYANKKTLEFVNQQVREEWQNAAERWTNAAYKWRETVQRLKSDDDQESENIADLDQIADCGNVHKFGTEIYSRVGLIIFYYYINGFFRKSR